MMLCEVTLHPDYPKETGSQKLTVLFEFPWHECFREKTWAWNQRDSQIQHYHCVHDHMPFNTSNLGLNLVICKLSLEIPTP